MRTEKIPLISISNIIDDRVDRTVRTIIDELHRQEARQVNIHLSCVRGGLHAPVFRLINHMRSSGITFNLFASKFIMSAGIYLYVVGTKRYADEKAYFRFHRPGCQSNGKYIVALTSNKELEDISSDRDDLCRLIKLRDEMIVMNDQAQELFSSNTGNSLEETYKLFEGEQKITSEEAQRIGLVHGILYPAAV